MANNSQKTSDIYFKLFDFMMTYNHRIWKTISSPVPSNDLIILCHLQLNGPMTITKIAQHHSISKQQMSLIIDRLSKKELVDKKNLIKDRRYIQISLSKKGKHMLDSLREQARNKFMERTTNLSDEDTEAFNKSVKVIKKMLAKMFEKNT